MRLSAAAGFVLVAQVSLLAPPAVGDEPAPAPAAPGAPTHVTATPGDARATVSWTAPDSDGGLPITTYTATSSDGQSCETTGELTCDVPTLSNGTAYVFTVTATNESGTSAASDPSAAVTPRTTPAAPTAVKVLAGDTRVVVSWAAPDSDGGSALTGYAVASVHDATKGCSPNPVTSTTCVVTGLTNGTAYSFRATATNEAGSSAASLPSPEITPGPINVRIGSFNIKNLYNPSNKSCPSWFSRLPHVVNDIVRSNADVIGVQEAYHPEDRAVLMAHLDDYQMTRPPSDPNGVDNRLLYNKRRIELVADSTNFEKYRKQVPGEYERDVLWARFRSIKNGREFVVFTTHLSPTSPASVRQDQWQRILTLAKDPTVLGNQNGTTLPAMITGDFNTNRFQKPANVMLPATKASGFPDVLDQKYASYSTTGMRLLGRTTNAWINSFNGCKKKVSKRSAKAPIGNNYDWIFASARLQLVDWVTLTPEIRKSKLVGPIASDHFMVTSTMTLPPPAG